MRGRHAALVILEQRVVGGVRVTVVIRFLAEQVDHRFEMWPERREIRCAPRMRPRFIGLALLFGEAAHERFGQLLCSRVVVERFRDERTFVRRESVTLFIQFMQERAHFRRGQQPVREARKRGQLLTARRRALRRHVHLLVPRQDRERRLQVRILAVSRPQILRFGFQHNGFLRFGRQAPRVDVRSRRRPVQRTATDHNESAEFNRRLVTLFRFDCRVQRTTRKTGRRDRCGDRELRAWTLQTNLPK